MTSPMYLLNLWVNRNFSPCLSTNNTFLSRNIYVLVNIFTALFFIDIRFDRWSITQINAVSLSAYFIIEIADSHLPKYILTVLLWQILAFRALYTNFLQIERKQWYRIRLLRTFLSSDPSINMCCLSNSRKVVKWCTYIDIRISPLLLLTTM